MSQNKSEARFGRDADPHQHREPSEITDITGDDRATGDDATVTDFTDSDDAIVLRGERLVAKTERIPYAAVRVRVRVETEERTITLRREVLEIEELPGDPGDYPEAKGIRKPREIILHEDRAVIEPVAYERVKLSRELIRQDQTVSGQVRREVLEVDESDLHRDRDADTAGRRGRDAETGVFADRESGVRIEDRRERDRF